MFDIYEKKIMPVYCLKEKESSGECHLFECEMSGNQCNCPDESICGKMEGSEKFGSNLFSCKNEKDARIVIAQLGRRVCGTCVSHLYETYE